MNDRKSYFPIEKIYESYYYNFIRMCALELLSPLCCSHELLFLFEINLSLQIVTSEVLILFRQIKFTYRRMPHVWN